jgi:hypothetical protein
MLGILDYGNPNSLEAIEQIVEIKQAHQRAMLS